MAWQSSPNFGKPAGQVNTHIWADASGAWGPSLEDERPRSGDFFSQYHQFRRGDDSTAHTPRTNSSTSRQRSRDEESPSIFLGCFGIKPKKKSSGKSRANSRDHDRPRRIDVGRPFEESPPSTANDSSTPSTSLDTRNYIFSGKSAEVLGIIPPRTITSAPWSRRSSPVEGRAEHSKESDIDEDSFLYPSTTASSGSTPWVRKREGALKAARKRTQMRFVTNKLDMVSMSVLPVSEDKEFGDHEPEWKSEKSLYTQDWYDEGSVDGDIEVQEILDMGKVDLAVQSHTTSRGEPETFAWLQLQEEAGKVASRWNMEQSHQSTSTVLSVVDEKQAVDLGSSATVLQQKDVPTRETYEVREVQPLSPKALNKITITEIRSPEEMRIRPSNHAKVSVAVTRVEETPTWIHQQRDVDEISPVQRLPLQTPLRDTDFFEWKAKHAMDFPIAPAHSMSKY